MIRITKESEYAFILLSTLLREEKVAQSASELAKKTGIMPTMTGKVLKRLVKHDILSSTRGAQGGYLLAKSAQDIGVLEVLEVMEGALGLVDCATNSPCHLHSHCGIGKFWRSMNEEVIALLADKTLLDMQEANVAHAVHPLKDMRYKR